MTIYSVVLVSSADFLGLLDYFFSETRTIFTARKMREILDTRR